MERLETYIPKIARKAASEINPAGDDETRMVLSDRMAAERSLEELASRYRDKPLPPLSEEMRKKLGAGIPEISE